MPSAGRECQPFTLCYLAPEAWRDLRKRSGTQRVDSKSPKARRSRPQLAMSLGLAAMRTSTPIAPPPSC
eukprot:12906957-Prorocentrum_lima.AAC.1